jgi:hypothetical protein
MSYRIAVLFRSIILLISSFLHTAVTSFRLHEADLFLFSLFSLLHFIVECSHFCLTPILLLFPGDKTSQYLYLFWYFSYMTYYCNFLNLNLNLSPASCLVYSIFNFSFAICISLFYFIKHYIERLCQRIGFRHNLKRNLFLDVTL